MIYTLCCAIALSLIVKFSFTFRSFSFIVSINSLKFPVVCGIAKPIILRIPSVSFILVWCSRSRIYIYTYSTIFVRFPVRYLILNSIPCVALSANVKFLYGLYILFVTIAVFFIRYTEFKLCYKTL